MDAGHRRQGMRSHAHTTMASELDYAEYVGALSCHHTPLLTVALT
jgi:hypothetical protein